MQKKEILPLGLSSATSAPPRFAFLFLCLLVFAGCATAPPKFQPLPEEEVRVPDLLFNAATRFAGPDAPRDLTVLDEARVQWNSDKSFRVTVHQIFAARVQPDRPLPPLISLNQDSQTLKIDTLRYYVLDPKGEFIPSSVKAEASWDPPAKDLPESLSQLVTVRLPELKAGQALEVKYTLETKTSTLLAEKEMKDATKPRPVAAEGSFAFLWNDHVPSIQRKLLVGIPKAVNLYGARFRLPKDLAIEEKESETGDKILRFELVKPLAPLPHESYQPPLQDLAPLTAFTVNKSWEEAALPYRKGVKRILEGDLAKVQEIIGEAGGNTALPLAERVSQVKAAVHKKIEWVDSGLPVYLNPVRTLEDIIDSGKGTSHDLAMVLSASLKWSKIPSKVFLYRKAPSGELLTDLPALSQFDGILLSVPTKKDPIWLDPTEPLAAADVLPALALGRQALAVEAPLDWASTPSFSAKDHRKERDLTMQFLPNNRLKCSAVMRAYGSSELALRQFFRLTTDEKRREAVQRGLAKRFPGVLLTDYRYGDYRNLKQTLEVHYTFEIQDYAEPKKDGFNFHPLVFEDVDDFLATLREGRRTPVVIPHSFNSVTRVVIKLPGGFKPGELPKDGTVANRVAEYFTHAKLEFGTPAFERYLGLKQRRIELGKEYQELLDFYKLVLTHDRTPFEALKNR